MVRTIRSSWRQALQSWYMAAFQIPWLPEALILARDARAIDRTFAGFSEADRRIYRDNALIPGAMTAMLNYYRANFSRLGPFAVKTPVIPTPTLLVWGDADRYVGAEAMLGVRDLVSDLTVRRLPGVSHWVQQEAPDAVNQALQDWLISHGLKVN